MLNINSIEKGIVIDHIKCGMGYKIFQLLKLDKADYTVFDDNMTVNIIENEKIKEKISLNLPEHFEGFIKCKNPRCITQSERSIVQKFSLVDKDTRTYKCDYCDHLYNVEE